MLISKGLEQFLRLNQKEASRVKNKIVRALLNSDVANNRSGSNKSNFKI